MRNGNECAGFAPGGKRSGCARRVKIRPCGRSSISRRARLSGQLLFGLSSELSFHGPADDQEEFLASLVALKDGVLAGDVESLPVGDLVPEAELAGFEAMFETVGGVSLLDVRRSMHLMEDDQAAGPWFVDAFGGVVVVRERVRERSGREFRKVFRAACRQDVLCQMATSGTAMSLR